jgi:hypothetical protein
MPKLFPNRVQKKHGYPVRSYSSFCQYLLDKAPAGINFHVEHLHFQGRNKCIYMEKLKFCQVIETNALFSANELEESVAKKVKITY